MTLSTNPTTAGPGLPTVETGDVDLLVGSVHSGAIAMSHGRGATLNGAIQPHGIPTTYYFEYGLSPSYGLRTHGAALPPRLASYYAENWEQGFNSWPVYFDCGRELLKEESSERGFLRITENGRFNDFNHEASGVLHLLTGFNTGPQDASVMLGGGDGDLRDAEISLRLRGVNWQPNGSELVAHIQSQSNIELMNNPGWKRANCIYSSHPLTDALLDGQWHDITFRLDNDSTRWTYAGNNATQQGPSAARYDYWPIDQALGHQNINFLWLTAFTNPENPPSGAIDFADFVLRYRNKSLLYPSNGGKLVRWPQDAPDDPALLTDGWRHGPGKTWRSSANPATPQEFVYAFDETVTIETIQLHQNPEWPAKDFEVLVSMDGTNFGLIWRHSLPQQGIPSVNFAFQIERGLAAQARFLMVRLLSGYQNEHWGLGEIEVFGTGAQMLLDDDWYHVNTDIRGLTPGQVYHYRLVAENAQGISYGPDQVFTVPASDKPQVKTGPASNVTATTAKLAGTLHPMSTPTYYYFEWGEDTGYLDEPVANANVAVVYVRRYERDTLERVQLPVPGAYAGQQMTPRPVFHHLHDLKPGTTYHYRLVALNQNGAGYGSDTTFTTPPADG